MLGKILMISNILFATCSAPKHKYPVNETYKKFVGDCVGKYRDLYEDLSEKCVEVFSLGNEFLMELLSENSNPSDKCTIRYSLEENGIEKTGNTVEFSAKELIELLSHFPNIKSFIHSWELEIINAHLKELEEKFYEEFNIEYSLLAQSKLNSHDHCKTFVNELVNNYKKYNSKMVELNNYSEVIKSAFNEIKTKRLDSDVVMKQTLEFLSSIMNSRIYITSKDLKSVKKYGNLSRGLNKKIEGLIKKDGNGKITGFY